MDRLNHRIQRFDARRHLHQQGRRPRAPQPGTFSWPEAVAVGPGRHACGPSTPAATGSSSSPADLATTRASPPYGGTGSRGRRSSTTPRAPTSPPTAWSGSPTPATTGSRSTTPSTDDLLRRFGVGQGTGAGQFSHPMGVAVTANAVYVADTGNNRVQKLSPRRRPPGDVSTRPQRARGHRRRARRHGLGGRHHEQPPRPPVGRTSPTSATASASLGTGDTPVLQPARPGRSATTRCTSPTPTTTGSRCSRCPARPSRRRPPLDAAAPAARSPTRAASRRSTRPASRSSTAPGTSPTPAAARVVTLNPTTGAATPADRDRSAQGPARPRGRRRRPDRPVGDQHRRQLGRAHLADRRPAARHAAAPG